MLAMDLADSVQATAPQIVAEGLKSGLVLNYTGPRTLRFLPPLIISREDVDTVMGMLESLLAE